ncbi:AAA family ATPase [Lederbergia lenta]|uniref:ATP-dependent metalloprotease FtsH n=1 Tax=Lederbergia lenta TaxID=1467 RepID=A0A2X4VSW0_LEDLE|nr:AAA family ATPase [Lederbergia lenta]MCM3110934.1 ATP-dependent metallopeptidase FtsH/Yme1/Tma family protein [Lederbergia lenta]MEC2325670.1 AAA family ATPase [Lederbergia lenta]SQI54003.1 ATP-dependent metalloprotease FtsH [Lederbergia lenta]
MKTNSRIAAKIVPLAIGFIVIVACVAWAVWTANKGTVIPFSAIEKTIQAQNGELVTLKEMSNGTLHIETPDGKFVSHFRPNSPLVEELVEKYNISYKYSEGSTLNNWLMGGILILLIATAIVIQRKGGIGAAKMKQSTSKETPLPSVTLNDIGGLPSEMKEEIQQTLEIIKDPGRSAKIGIKAPKGILLYGPPGTGKTLLAQAIAREIGAKFYSASGSAFTELFVGVGASRIRSLFENARKQSPAVIFIDEVDALAGKRKAHGGEEAEKTLTELLVQLDGGHENEGILFIAATNRKDMLDDAFLRPGRIDFTFQVPLPDTQGRKEIIDIHTKGKRLSEAVFASLNTLAESTSGFSGAELSSLFESASRKAVREGRDVVDMKDLDYAIDRTILGSTSRTLNDPDTKRRVAIHEAGHALIAALTKPGSVRKATIIPRGQALGYVAPIQKELHLTTTSELLDQVSMILAGGVAERLFLGEHSIGVSGDVQQAKNILEQMVDTGMLEDGFTLTFQKAERETKMQELFQIALKKTELMINGHQKEYQELVEALLKKETLEGTEVQEIVDGCQSHELDNVAVYS